MQENSLELLMLPRAADLGGEPLGELLQAAGVFQLNLCFAAEELLQVLQQLDARLGLLLQAFELLHQLVTDLCPSKTADRNVWVNCLCSCHNSAQHTPREGVEETQRSTQHCTTALFASSHTHTHSDLKWQDSFCSDSKIHQMNLHTNILNKNLMA